MGADAAVDPDADFEFDLWDELSTMIALRISQHERSQQAEIGPSGLGTPCNRKLAYRLLQLPAINGHDEADEAEVRVARAPWRPTVGTAVHLWLATMLTDLNERELASGLHDVDSGGNCRVSWCSYFSDADEPEHTPRFAVEFETDVGTIGGKLKKGHLDVYDRKHKAVVDWKIVGPKSLKDKHAAVTSTEHTVGDEYRVQAHVYAGGVARSLGWDVERVAVCFLPMNGELRDGFVWSERYDPEIRARAFKRARALWEALGAHYVEEVVSGPDLRREVLSYDAEQVGAVVARLRTAPDYCHRCDWFTPGRRGGDLTGCGGDKSIYEDADLDHGFEDLLGAD